MAFQSASDLDDDFVAVRSFQAAVDRLRVSSFRLESDVIVKATQPTDVSLLTEIATPGTAHPVDDVINEAFAVFDHRMRMNHPRFLGFIPSPSSPFSWLGECITSAFNTFAGCKFEGAGPSIIEDTLLKWLASRIGLPPTAGGVFVSGGSMANLTAMAVARDHCLPHGKTFLGVAYVSDQTHSSIAKALRILGFAQDQIRCITTNVRFEMDPDRLARAIVADRERGLIPFVVIASCGTTNTGCVDPLSQLAQICHREGLWMHVDGAYGASVALSASRTDLIAGLEQADSISWDGHKWLFQTYGCGLLLVRDKTHLLCSFSTDAEYLRDASEEESVPNFWNYGIELTRPARAMKLWFTLRVLGIDAIGRMIDHGFILAERAERELRKLPYWEITSRAAMAILTFRYTPPSKTPPEWDALNEAISRRLLAENIVGILTTKLRGMVVLRICSIHPSLVEAEMTSIILTVDKVAQSVLLTSV